MNKFFVLSKKELIAFLDKSVKEDFACIVSGNIEDFVSNISPGGISRYKGDYRTVTFSFPEAAYTKIAPIGMSQVEVQAAMVNILAIHGVPASLLSVEAKKIFDKQNAQKSEDAANDTRTGESI